MIVGTYVYYCKYIILAYIVSRRRDVAGRDKGSKKVKKKERERGRSFFFICSSATRYNNIVTR